MSGWQPAVIDPMTALIALGDARFWAPWQAERRGQPVLVRREPFSPSLLAVRDERLRMLGTSGLLADAGASADADVTPGLAVRRAQPFAPSKRVYAPEELMPSPEEQARWFDLLDEHNERCGRMTSDISSTDRLDQQPRQIGKFVCVLAIIAAAHLIGFGLKKRNRRPRRALKQMVGAGDEE